MFLILFVKLVQSVNHGVILVYIGVSIDGFVVDDEGRSSFEVRQVAGIKVLELRFGKHVLRMAVEKNKMIEGSLNTVFREWMK